MSSVVTVLSIISNKYGLNNNTVTLLYHFDKKSSTTHRRTMQSELPCVHVNHLKFHNTCRTYVRDTIILIAMLWGKKMDPCECDLPTINSWWYCYNSDTQSGMFNVCSRSMFIKSPTACKHDGHTYTKTRSNRSNNDTQPEVVQQC